MNRKTTWQAMELRTKFSLAVLTAFGLLMLFAAVTRAQTCSSVLRKSASIGGCDNVHFAWIYTGQSPVVSQRLTYGDGFSPPISATARNYSRTGVGCGYSVSVTITQTYANGQTCFVTEGDNHNRPCNQCASNGNSPQTSIVSSANFRSATARDSLASIFPDPGVTFTDQTAYATTLPLPTSLGGVTVTIDGQLCGLVAVTPGQINFHLPANLPDFITEVQATIDTTRSPVARFFGRPQINPNAPGVFTVNAAGTGAAASVWLVVKPDGRQIYYAPGNLQFASGDTVVLVLYGTGINERVCDLILGNGSMVRAQYCGASWMQGVQQMNFILTPSQLWSGRIGGFVRITRPGVGWWDSQGVEFQR